MDIVPLQPSILCDWWLCWDEFASLTESFLWRSSIKDLISAEGYFLGKYPCQARLCLHHSTIDLKSRLAFCMLDAWAKSGMYLLSVIVFSFESFDKSVWKVTRLVNSEFPHRMRFEIGPIKACPNIGKRTRARSQPSCDNVWSYCRRHTFQT